MKRTLCTLLLALLLPMFSDAQMRWSTLEELPLYGRIGEEGYSRRYTRLPDSLQQVSRDGVWYLGQHTAGLFLRFRSNATTIAARWESHHMTFMHHMCITGTRGLDLYAWVDGRWRFVNSGRPSTTDRKNEATIIDHMEAEEREYMLYLPLYDGIDALELGVNEEATLLPPALEYPVRKNPIVCYGTSILQGGCVTRPGMAHTNIISRRFNREVYNLGFSGNGRLDYEIAEMMATVDAGVFVLDFVPNATVEEMDERAVKFFRILRDAHPDVPVIFLEDPHFEHGYFDTKIATEVARKNAKVREIFKQLQASGEKQIYFIPSDNMLGDDSEATIDGIHFTDLGMMRYADLVEPVIRKALKRAKKL